MIIRSSKRSLIYKYLSSSNLIQNRKCSLNPWSSTIYRKNDLPVLPFISLKYCHILMNYIFLTSSLSGTPQHLGSYSISYRWAPKKLTQKNFILKFSDLCTLDRELWSLQWFLERLLQTDLFKHRSAHFHQYWWSSIPKISGRVYSKSELY